MQQVGGGAEVSKRVQDAPPLDPATTLPPSPDRSLFSSVRQLQKARPCGYGRKLGFAVFTTLSGALAFSLLTDSGRQTRAVLPLLPEAGQVLAWTGLRLDQVALSGQRFTADADIFDAIDMRSARSLLSFDASAARRRVERLPWIATASISRVFPGSLDVRVTERKPAALWLHGGQAQLIDATGRVLSAAKPNTQTGLPRVAGEGAAAQARALLDLVVRYPRIRERFELAERVGERRWTLRLTNNVTVHLAADREAVAFAALSAPDDLGALLTGHDLIIDLRTRGRITVRPDLRSKGASIASVTQS